MLASAAKSLDQGKSEADKQKGGIVGEAGGGLAGAAAGAAAGGSLTPHPVTSHPENTSYVTFTISDSDDLNILLNGGAPSDSDEQ